MADKDTQSSLHSLLTLFDQRRNLNYAFNTAGAVNNTNIHLSALSNRSSSEQYIPVEIPNNLKKVINIIDDVLAYWKINFAPSLEAINGAFQDMTDAINLLQESKQFARNASMKTSFTIKIDNSIKDISEARKLVRTLGEVFEGVRKLSADKKTDICEQFHSKINEIRIFIFVLLSEIS